MGDPAVLLIKVIFIVFIPFLNTETTTTTTVKRCQSHLFKTQTRAVGVCFLPKFRHDKINYSHKSNICLYIYVGPYFVPSTYLALFSCSLLLAVAISKTKKIAVKSAASAKMISLSDKPTNRSKKTISRSLYEGGSKYKRDILQSIFSMQRRFSLICAAERSLQVMFSSIAQLIDYLLKVKTLTDHLMTQ